MWVQCAFLERWSNHRLLAVLWKRHSLEGGVTDVGNDDMIEVVDQGHIGALTVLDPVCRLRHWSLHSSGLTKAVQNRWQCSWMDG